MIIRVSTHKLHKIHILFDPYIVHSVNCVLKHKGVKNYHVHFLAVFYSMAEYNIRIHVDFVFSFYTFTNKMCKKCEKFLDKI